MTRAQCPRCWYVVSVNKIGSEYYGIIESDIEFIEFSAIRGCVSFSRTYPKNQWGGDSQSFENTFSKYDLHSLFLTSPVPIRALTYSEIKQAYRVLSGK